MIHRSNQVEGILQKPSITAHRGDSGRYAENTRAAFMSALDVGADGVEADVHLSSDGVPIIAHDFSLKRVTGVRGYLADYTHQQLQSMDFSSWKESEIPLSYGSVTEQLVTLEALLDMLLAANRGVKLLLELKHPSPFGYQLEDMVMQTLVAYGYNPQTSMLEVGAGNVNIVLMSFRHSALLRLVEYHHVAPHGISPLFNKNATRRRRRDGEARVFAMRHPSSVIGAGLRYVRSNPLEVRRWAASGRELSVWTVNKVLDALFLYGIGVQSMTTNYPAELNKVFRKYALLCS